MRKIYLFCSAGMSSSIVAQKMQTLANEKGLELEMQEFPEAKIAEEADKADIILLTPQIKYREAEVRKNYPTKTIYLIEMQDYGLMKIENILTKCLATAG